MTKQLTVFLAKKVVTMDPGRPTAQAIAVQDDRIVSVGTLESMRPWLERKPHTIDRAFESRVLMPGFIDPHTHLAASGVFLSLKYVGPIDSLGPQGAVAGLPTITAVLARIRLFHESMDDPLRPIIAWGLDPAVQGAALDRDELDRISVVRPIWVLAYAPHHVYCNSAMLKYLDIDDSATMYGLGRYADGRLNGVFSEVEAVQFALKAAQVELSSEQTAKDGLRMLGDVARNAGVTMTADMAFGFTNADVEWRTHHEVVNDPSFPLRMLLVPVEAYLNRVYGDTALVALQELFARSNDKLRIHGVKFFGDGSYPAMSLRVGFPGYLDGSNGNRGDIAWPDMVTRMLPYWRAGTHIHAHANGDETIDMTLDVLAELQRVHPRFDHRFTIEHYCISSPHQAVRLKALGGIASVNNYFVHFRSQLHSAVGFGPDRSEATARLASLERAGVTFAMHSDFSLVAVPLQPLLAVKIAVDRLALDGCTVMAPGERIGLERALRAITIDAAHVLRMDDRVGSIEVGKFADFTVLDADPFEVPVSSLAEIPVWGTVLGGTKHQASTGDK